MSIGVMCTCAPAISQTIRHHFPPYEVLKSRLLYSILRQSRSASGHDDRLNSEASVNNPNQIILRKYQPSYLRSVQPFVGTGKRLDLEEDCIQLRQDTFKSKSQKSSGHDLERTGGDCSAQEAEVDMVRTSRLD